MNHDDILRKPYRRILSADETGAFTATINEFDGLVAFGATPDEAIARLEEAACDWLDAAEQAGYQVPEPMNFDACSGRIALRLSRRLHAQAAALAADEGTSLNQLINNAVAMYLGRQVGRDTALRDAQQAVKFARGIQHAATAPAGWVAVSQRDQVVATNE